MAENSFVRYKKILKICRTAASSCGGDVLDPNYKVTFLTRFVIASAGLFLILSIYTMYHSLVIQGDWKLMLQSLSVVGTCLQGMSKLFSGIILTKIVVTIYGRIYKVYEDYHEDADYIQVLERQVDFTSFVLKLAASLTVATMTVIVAYPIIYNSIYGQKLPVIHFLIPGLSMTTDRGYIIYAVFHSFCVILGGCGNCAADMLTFVGITHVPMFKEVFKVKCLKLCRAISSRDQKQVSELLLDILKWHQHYNKYIADVESVFFAPIFVQVFTSVAGICCTVFSIITRSWPAAYIYFFYCLLIMYAYCGLGNIVDLSNDDVETAVYSDILWYELAVSEQKQVLLMLRRSQKSVSLTIGKVMPLSMAAALQLTKCIYSYMMMLARFLDEDL